ncbi:response regulator [Tsuneonella sp. HG249]
MTVPLKKLTTVPEVERPSSAKILIVDDDQRNLLALTEVLAPLAEVVTVSSGRDALRALLHDDFAVILLDVFMPDMDGYETAGVIRQREQTARIPIIFLSAVNKETEHLMRGYEMGAVDYVFKPVDPLILRSKTAVFVDLYELRQEVEERNRAEQQANEAKLRAEQQRLEIDRELQAARLRQAAILKSLPVVLFEASFSQEEGLRRKVVGDENAAQIEGDLGQVKIDDPHWEDHIPADDRAEIERAYSASTGDGSRTSVRYRWAADSATTRYFLEQAVRIDERTWVGSITDVTAQSVLESQLLQAQKIDALGQLTGGVAHDFNNLLAAILGGLELLGRRVQMNEQAEQIVAQMRQAANQGVALVKSLLSFARKQPLLPVAVDPEGLRHSVLPLAEHALGKSHRIEWRSDCGNCEFFADPALLTLAVLNLIINARDAMPEGGLVEVDVTYPEEGGAESDSLRIAVRDHGTGIPDEIVEKVTEPFFTTKPAGKGTGLGLSMVAGFVEQSGGKLAFRKPQGGGTCVDIILPTAKACGPADDKAGDQASSGTGRGSPEAKTPSSDRVLLVDDDDIVRTILADVLEDLGFAVSSAADGEQALEILRGEGAQIRLVLSDITMPRMNGIELVKAMDAERMETPIVLMTGNLSPDLVAQLPKEIEVLTKPLTEKVLQELLSA